MTSTAKDGIRVVWGLSGWEGVWGSGIGVLVELGFGLIETFCAGPGVEVSLVFNHEKQDLIANQFCSVDPSF